VGFQIIKDVKYSPARDVVHSMPDIIRSAYEAAIGGKFADFDDWLKHEGFGEDDILHGFNTYIKFMGEAPKGYDINLTQALDASGWRALSWQVRVAVGYYSFFIMAGTFFRGAQEAVDEECDIPRLKVLVAAGRELDRYERMPRWRRWLYRKRRRLVPYTIADDK
jgi:hypothetical protein